MPIQKPEEFRAAAARKRKTVDVEVDGIGTVRLRSLSAAESLRFPAEVKKAQAEGREVAGLAFSLIAVSWIGEDGEPWFSEEEGVAMAKSLDPDTFAQLTTAVLDLNGLNETAVEDAVKNSEASRGGSAPTDSPKNSDTPTST